MDRRNAWFIRLRERLKAKRGHKCEHCGDPFSLEFAHKEPTGVQGRGRGRNRRLLDILRNPNKYLLLCKPCHKRYDNDQEGLQANSSLPQGC